MRFTTTAISLTIAVIMTMIGATNVVVAQDRLPAYVRSNSFVTGQVLGCALRYETYYAETVRRAADAGRTLPPNYQLNLIAGLDVTALRDDAHRALVAQSSTESPIEEVIGAIILDPDRYSSQGFISRLGQWREHGSFACQGRCVGIGHGTLAADLAEGEAFTGAIIGMLAGAQYGYSSIPQRWLNRLAWRNRIRAVGHQLIETA